jgi:hypothetical protein
LATITDGDGNPTTIERTGDGDPTAIVGPTASAPRSRRMPMGISSILTTGAAMHIAYTDSLLTS